MTRAVSAHEQYVAEQVLALKVDYAALEPEAGGGPSGEGELDGRKVRWRLTQVSSS